MQPEEFREWLERFQQYFPTAARWLRETSAAQEKELGPEHRTSSAWYQDVFRHLEKSDCMAALLAIFDGRADKWYSHDDIPAHVARAAKSIRARRMEAAERVRRNRDHLADEREAVHGGQSSGHAFRRSQYLRRKLREGGAGPEQIKVAMRDYVSRYLATGNDDIGTWTR